MYYECMSCYMRRVIDKCLLLLYKKMYNDDIHFFIQENVYRLIRDDV